MQEALEVHIGTYSPDDWSRRAKMPVRAGFPRITGPQIVTEPIGWAELGLDPRWAGDDPSTAVAAIEASGLLGTDWARFQLGAERREEPALYISTSTPPDRPIRGMPDWTSSLSAFQGGAREVEFPHQDSFKIHSRSISLARPPELGDGLSTTDRDLALRIRTVTGARWMLLDDPEDEDEFFGTWTPLLITPDGLTVAAIWTDDGEYDTPTYHYVVPGLPTYVPILRWLTDRAVPDLIPTAAARTRRYIAEQPDLQSTREREICDQLTTQTTRYEKAKAEFEQQLADEREAVTAVRDPLLFGTGTALEEAVLRVLVDANVAAVRLDEVLGTRSADLLAEYDGRRILIEVKSVSGNASEVLADAPRKHLRTWAELRPDRPVDGVVLVVNHQHKLPPADRTPTVFVRPEMVRTLDYPVVTTLELFDLWRRDQFSGVRTVFGLEDSAF